MIRLSFIIAKYFILYNSIKHNFSSNFYVFFWEQMITLQISSVNLGFLYSKLWKSSECKGTFVRISKHTIAFNIFSISFHFLIAHKYHFFLSKRAAILIIHLRKSFRWTWSVALKFQKKVALHQIKKKYLFFQHTAFFFVIQLCSFPFIIVITNL